MGGKHATSSLNPSVTSINIHLAKAMPLGTGGLGYACSACNGATIGKHCPAFLRGFSVNGSPALWPAPFQRQP
jgi:hypothetical protein